MTFQTHDLGSGYSLVIVRGIGDKVDMASLAVAKPEGPCVLWTGPLETLRRAVSAEEKEG